MIRSSATSGWYGLDLDAAGWFGRMRFSARSAAEATGGRLEGPDVERALKDGFTTGGGLGLGLGGARRLSNEFSIDSRPGEGTRVTIARWTA